MKASWLPAPSFPAVNSGQPVTPAAAVKPVNLQLPFPLPLPLSSDPLARGSSQADYQESAVFRAPTRNVHYNSRPARLAKNHSGKLKPQPSKTAHSRTSLEGKVSDESSIDDLNDNFDDRRDSLAYSIRANTAGNTDSEPGGDESGHRERLFKSISVLGSTGPRRAQSSSAVQEMVQSLLTANSIEALARPLRSLVGDLDSLGSPSPLQSLVLRAAKTLLQRPAVASSGVSGGSISLGEIRASLTEGVDRAATVATEQQAAANIWLPIYLLNLDRPRTPRQRQQAIERLDMIERRVSANANRSKG